MKILFFARRFHPQIGGVEKHVLEVGKRLVSRGYDVTVISEELDDLPKENKIEGINILKIKVGKDGKLKKFRIWKELFKHIDLISSSDIVHCHDVFFWYLPFRFIFPFKKIFTTFHGYEGNKIPTKKAILMHKIAERLSFGNICVGDFLKKWYGTKPNFVIYGGVDPKLVKLGLNNIKPTKEAVFLGRLEEETGILKYLQAIKLLKNNGVNIKLDVFGYGSLMKKSKKYAKDNKLTVSFKGLVSNPENLLTEYRYVFTSRYLGILESLAARRPIFAEYNNAIKKDYLEMSVFSSYISISQSPEEIKNAFIKEKSTKHEEGFNFTRKLTWEFVTDIYLKLWQGNK